MSTYRITTLRRTLLKLMLAASVVAAVIVGIAVSVYEQTTFKPRAVISLRQQADTLAAVILPPLEFNDSVTATQYLETRRQYPDIVAVGLYSLDGRQVANYVRSADIVMHWPRRPSADSYEFVGGKLHLWHAVQGYGSVAGYLFLCADMPPLYARLPQYGIMASAVMLALVAASLMLLRGLNLHLLRPLQLLTETTERVTLDKSYGRAAVVKHNEMGRLASALNDMLGTIQQREEELRGSESRLRSIIDNEPECVKVIALDGTLTEINPAGLRLLQAPSFEAAMTQPLLQYVAAESREPFRDMFRRVTQGASDGVEFELVGLQGGRRWLEARAVPMRDAQGRIVSVLAISRDVTERRNFERTKANRSAQQAVVVRLGLEAFSAPNLHALLERAANAVADALGSDYTAIFDVQADGSGAKLQAGTGWGPQTVGELVIPIANDTLAGRTLAHQTPVVIDDTLTTDSPLSKPVLRDRYGVRSSVCVAIRGAGQPWGLLAAHSKSIRAFSNDDVSLLQEVANLLAQAIQRLSAESARRAAESQLLQSQKMEALGRLAGGIAHDFNNLLSAILGNVQLAKEDVGAGHAALVSLEEIRRAGQRSKELVQRILAFSRHQEPCKEHIRLQSVVEEAGRLLRATIPAQIEIVLNIDAAAPATMADGGQLHQCILNLATNAWQAIGNKPGRIDLSLSYAEVFKTMPGVIRLKPGRYVRIDVKDNGGGMDDRTRAHIFEPFFTTKPLGEGTGLGLSMVHGIMESHGGAIDVQSEAGQGSTFSLHFPVLGSEASTGQPFVATAAAATTSTGAHILYVDDEEPLVFLATRLLERLGYRVSGYTRADMAVKAFREKPDDFDLIVTDLSMPGMSGMEVARYVLSIRRDITVVLASGYLRQSDIDIAKAIGIREVILKPNTVEGLGPIVQRLLATA